MNDETLSTAPKPFVFVLMPFNEDFDDIYKLGIKETAKEVGSYAERVDEQIFTEGILERIFNQISKADVIVADMTGRNPNVFYEVGYAHALGKIVLLLTQKADDIPFDLKHKQHIIYGNGGSKIQSLRSELAPRLNWAINESKRKGKEDNQGRILISASPLNRNYVDKFTEIPEDCFSKPIPLITCSDPVLIFQLHNNSLQKIPSIKHIYLFTNNPKPLSIIRTDSSYQLVYNSNANDKLPLKYRIPANIPSIPPNAVEIFYISVGDSHIGSVVSYKLRIHISNSYYDFSFQVQGTM
ncbi:nucleoside 2-deoxyribosyltransferase [Methanosarcina sp.]|uniref:nucleoside 2-deoxyribosyltransferase n=1 Tax=Methanosarcina sp. TaxID=2213 RepID=UPI0029881AA4|nr:nucleoside 2-deoxyribosyltransferase [Methanosarcina sp.]MDW5551485.1 hypothetical protein [Methanosarcina sp.]MDW5554399.1 hypothetical protein [Methanosarcina sp.]MDW5560616.1 hypothetical protein [Methanosarcina sp.]